MNIIEKLCKLYLERKSKYNEKNHPFVSLNGFKVISEYEYEDYLYLRSIDKRPIFGSNIGRYYGVKFIESKKGGENASKRTN